MTRIPAGRRTRASQRIAVVLGLCSIAATGCRPKNEFVPPPPPKVTVAQPHREKVADSIDFVGTTKSVATVELRARVGGYLERIAFTDGQNVKAGELLFVIEKAPFEAALQAADAEVQKAEAALLLADATLARTRQLVETNSVSKQQFDVDEAQRATAAANVASAKAALKQANLNLGYAEIRAPTSGRIGRRLIDVGNLVYAEQSLLAVIESITPIYAEFYVSDADLLRFMEMLREHKLPDPAVKPPTLYLGLENEAGFPHVGRLDFRQFGVNSGTGTILRRAVYDNADGKLIPGLYCRLRATLGEPQPALLVDRRAVGTDQRGDYLLLVNDKNVVEYRTVKLGIVIGDMQVVTSGVKAEDWIVINGLQRARPGSQVTPEKGRMPAGSIDKNERLTEDSQAAPLATPTKGSGPHNPPGEPNSPRAPNVDAPPVKTPKTAPQANRDPAA